METNSFFTWHIFLEVGKTQDLPSKFWQTLGDTLIVRVSPTICQIGLASLIFGKNAKNTPPTVWQRTWQFLATWEKPASYV
jgi:hypothetical protein